MTDKIWIGADPGGEGNFGIAILRDGVAITVCVDHADEAVTFIQQSVKDAIPAAVGIDAPMWWSSGRSSDRKADQWLRSTYGLSGGNVQTANSLRGAALVQGMMFAERMRSQFPGIPITESHPKALWAALAKPSWENFCNECRIQVRLTGEQEHERDAVLAAFAAREGFEGRWTLDLSVNRLPSEQNPKDYWLKPVHYYWPDPSGGNQPLPHQIEPPAR